MDDLYSVQWAGQGTGGSGKTHFLLTAPEPIGVQLFGDPQGVKTLLRKPEFKGRDVHVIEYNFQPGKLKIEDRPKAALDALNQFIEDYHSGLKQFRTMGWDKEDKVWELLRYARLENYTDRPASYYELNLEYQGWLADAAEASVNLGVLRGMKEVWGQNSKGSPTGTGTYTARGQKEVNEMVQVVLHHYWSDDDREFKVRIGGQVGEEPKCRIGPATELIGDVCGNLDFTTLAMMLYPETIDTPEVWTR